MYHTAALGVVYDKETHEQVHFNGHDDDIRALDIHPDKIRVVTGQMGKEPKKGSSTRKHQTTPKANGEINSKKKKGKKKKEIERRRSKLQRGGRNGFRLTYRESNYY